jgi:hypothetical protein
MSTEKTYDQKLSNPKDSFGSAKLDMGNVPYTLLISAACAFLEGALKYGRFNWRIAGVRASIYHAALLRHVAKWWNGQDRDKATRVHHLDNAIACLTIIRDAELYGKLEDDRPPCPDPDALAKLIDDSADTVTHLKEMFSGHMPKQYTIADTRADTVTHLKEMFSGHMPKQYTIDDTRADTRADHQPAPPDHRRADPRRCP